MFQLVKLDNKVSDFLTKDKVEKIEQILQSNIIQDILTMTNAAKIKTALKSVVPLSKQSPSRERENS